MTRAPRSAGRATLSPDEHAKNLEFWTGGHNYWEARQRNEKPPIYNDAPCMGFYRRPIREQTEAGKWITVGQTPIAIFMNGKILTARIGHAKHGRDVIGDELNELWGWVAENDISEEWYDAVSRRSEPWPDAHDATKDKAPRDVVVPTTGEVITIDAFEAPADERFSASIHELIDGVSQYATIDSDEMAARAQSLRSELTTERGKADKAREAEKRPHFEAGKAVDAKYQPIIKSADEGATKLRGYIGAWEDVKRAAARLAQQKADKEAAEHARQVREAEAKNAPPPPPPEAAKPNTPPPSAQIKGASGRAASVKVEVFITEIDADKVFQQFKGNGEVIALLTTLAQKAIRAGITVDGATTEERSTVR